MLTLESHRNACDVVGESLGTVPAEIDAALPYHGIWGMYLAEFQDWSDAAEVAAPTARDMALIGTHDTPTFAGWLAATDIPERVRYGLLPESAVPAVREERAPAAAGLAPRLERPAPGPPGLFTALPPSRPPPATLPS